MGLKWDPACHKVNNIFLSRHVPKCYTNLIDREKCLGGEQRRALLCIFSLRQNKVVKMRNERKQQVNNKLLMTFINGSGGILINTFRDTELIF